MPMLHQRLSPIWGIGVLVSALAMSAWAQLPGGTQPSADEIRKLKIQYLEECCYNASGVSEESIAEIPTDKLLQYPALRKAAEAQVPRLNQMFAGRYLGSVVALDGFKPHILYFVKGLSAADRARVTADPALVGVQLANTAYAQRDIPGLTRKLQKEQRLRELSPQEKAASLHSYDIYHASLQSVNALPDAVFIQHWPADMNALSDAVSKIFGEQLVSMAWNNDVLGHATLDAFIYQALPAQLQHLRGDAELRDVHVVPFPISKAEIERIQNRIVEVLVNPSKSNVQPLMVSLSFDYVRRKFDVGVLEGQVEKARQLLLSQADIPAAYYDVQERLPIQLFNTPVDAQ